MKLTRSNKVLLTLGSVGVAATIAGAGTWATFTDTETATQDVATGTVVLVEDTALFETDIADVAPGDTIQRAFTLANGGSLDMKTIAVSVATEDTDELFSGVDEAGDPDADQALKVKVQRCSVPWADGDDADSLLECTGTTSLILDEATADGASDTWSTTDLSLGAADPDVTNHLLATYRLPAGAGNLAQNDGGTLTWTFTATQRDGVAS